ncbi:MAG: DUF354 domain-containing protein [Gammaproteobacteria bacterium]|nr:DUF354 domain-containing protein [Gammaproteobacteria bacterium]
MSKNFWFDLENTPDVLFFEPISKRLREAGHTVYTTCRNYSGVPELAELYGIGGDITGSHAGEKFYKKVAVGLLRSYLLAKWSKGKKIDLAVGFGSRPLAVACGLLRIPNASVYDYEHVSIGALNRFCQHIFVPEEVPLSYLTARGTPQRKIVRYSGLKEEVYTDVYQHDKGLLARLGCDESKIIVTIRPPATLAHYHDHSSEEICCRVLEKIAKDSSVEAILMTRADDNSFDRFLACDNIKDLPFQVKGLDLIANSDLVISGGGTMVREAVALGVPAYSLFTGKQGAVDEQLSREGRLILVRKLEDAAKVCFQKRLRSQTAGDKKAPVLDFFVDAFSALAERMPV